MNAIAVGATDALGPFLEAIPEAHAKLDADTPMQGIGQPEDIAAAALYLWSLVGAAG